MIGRIWRFLLGAGALGALIVFVASLLGPVWFPLDVLAHFRIQLGIGALALTIIAALSGAPRSAAVGAILVAGVALSMGPALRRSEQPPAEGCRSVPLRVAVANILFHNHKPEPAIDALLALDADVLATLETTPRFSDLRSRLHARYPYVTLSPNRVNEVGFYTMIWSKRPLVMSDDGGGGDDAPNFAQVEIEVEGTRLAILATHFSWPLVRQEPQLAGLSALMQDAAPLRVVMGDFNAAPWSEALRRVAEATETRIIEGLRLTWRGRVPPGVPMPPGLPIDHMLISPGIGVDAIQRAWIPASDHRGLVADLRIPLC